MSVSESHFSSNTASAGGAIAADCTPEVCVDNLPRDTCASTVTKVAATWFVGNEATGDGAGLHVARHLLELTAAGTGFVNNTGVRGAAVFAEPTANVTVDGRVGTLAQDQLLMVANVSSNAALSYGAGIASPPLQGIWEAPPVSPDGMTMAGTDMCGAGGGCVVATIDAFGNTPVIPTVVEIAVTPSGVRLDGPRFVLVAGGSSDPIPSLGVRPVGDPASFPTAVAAVIQLRFAQNGAVAAESEALAVTVTRCGVGYGALGGGSDGWACQPCAAGEFSADQSWQACEPCPVGYFTPAGEVGAEACEWCAAGFGWDSAGGGCELCAAGTYSSGPTFEAPCDGCDDGLTTSGAGANACAVVSPAVGTPWWIWALIGGAVLVVVVVVGVVAWRSSRRSVISRYYIGADLIELCACVCVFVCLCVCVCVRGCVRVWCCCCC